MLKLEAARTPLRLATAGDEAGIFQHLQVLCDCGHAHIERLRKFRDRRVALGKAREDGQARRISERGEGSADRLHGYFRSSFVINL